MMINLGLTTKGLVKGVSRATRNLNGFRKSVGLSTRMMNKLNTTFIHTAQRLASLYIMFQTFKTLLRGLYYPITEGFEYNKTIEEQVTSLTALTVATSKNVTSTGRQISITEKYNMAQKESLEVMEALKKINEMTPHTLAETAKIYKTIYAQSKQAGSSTKQMLETTKLLSIASKAGGIELNTLLKSIDSLGTGTYMANSEFGKFAASLGIAREEVQRLSKAGEGKALAYINKKLGDLNFKMDTFAIATSQAQNAWNKFSGELAKPFFEIAKNVLKDITTELNNMSADSKIMANAKIGFLTLASATLTAATSALKGIMLLSKGITKFVLNLKILIKEAKLEILELKDMFTMTSMPLALRAYGKLKGLWSDGSDKILGINQKIKTEAEKAREELSKLQDELAKNDDTPVIDQMLSTLDKFAENIGKRIEAQKNNIKKTLKEAKIEFDNTFGAAAGWFSGDEVLKQVSGGDGKLVGKDVLSDMEEQLKSFYNTNSDLSTQTASVWKNAFKGIENALIDFAKGTEGAFGNLINAILEDIARLQIKTQLINPIMAEMFPNIVASANGNAFMNGKLQAFASGGIVNSPTLFNHSGGVGLMGEAGSEAIMPLQRINGKLGVAATTSGSNVIINIENKSGTPISADMISSFQKQSSTGESQKVVNIVLDAVNRNVNGLRDVLQARR